MFLSSSVKNRIDTPLVLTVGIIPSWPGKAMLEDLNGMYRFTCGHGTTGLALAWRLTDRVPCQTRQTYQPIQWLDHQQQYR